jgi:hypothetical protein
VLLFSMLLRLNSALMTCMKCMQRFCTVQLDAMRRRSSVAVTVDPETGASHLSLTVAPTAKRPSISSTTAAVASGTTAAAQTSNDAIVAAATTAVNGSSAVAGTGTRRRSSGGNGSALSGTTAAATTAAADAGARQRGIEYGNKALKYVLVVQMLFHLRIMMFAQV